MSNTFKETCPHCGAYAMFKIVWESGQGVRWGTDTAVPLAAECAACLYPVACLFTPYGRRLQLWPKKVSGKDFLDVPNHIASAADEAHRSLSMNLNRAAVLLARAVVEATAKEKGVTSGTLATKIDVLYDRRLIREHVKEGAHEIRFLGNEMAHGDFADEVSDEDATVTLVLMDEILLEVFQSPARVSKAREARLAKTPQTS
ncbi:DUF4145 domain-containing protein [Catellatospora aurea]|uniref:DUF4145 domain-containing protein n=1 Tax=Catellatospora aurea TaxID=1337874 RepID=A0ABW2GZ78_9ACTN